MNPHPYRHNHAHAIHTLADYSVALGKTGWQARLCNDRAAYLPALKLLLIADVHLGKAAHFRAAGLAIPAQVAARDLARLSRLLQHYQPQQVVIAGDFLHATPNTEAAQFRDWRRDHREIRFTLIRGNHDRLAAPAYRALAIDQCSDSLNLAGADGGQALRITHHPRTTACHAHDDAFVVCGHIHPGVMLNAGQHASLKLPCFMLDAHQLILPAFSLFTGLDTTFMPHYGEHQLQRFALTPSRVIALSGSR